MIQTGVMQVKPQPTHKAKLALHNPGRMIVILLKEQKEPSVPNLLLLFQRLQSRKKLSLNRHQKQLKNSYKVQGGKVQKAKFL